MEEDFTFSGAGSGGGIAASVKGSGGLFSQKRARFSLVIEHFWDEKEEILKWGEVLTKRS